MKRSGWKTAVKLLLSVLVAALVIFISVKYLLPLCRLLTTENGREEICLIMDGYGIYAPLLFMGLIVLQIVIAFIPGGPLELVGGMLFGGFEGTLWTVAGTALGTALVYLLVKLFGRPLVHFFISEERMKRFSVLQSEEKLEFLVFILFLIPGIPKDLLTYIVPLTKMNGIRFIFISTLARLPALVASVFMGDSLSEGRYWLCIVIAVIAAVGTFAGFQMKHKFENNKEKSDSL